MGAPHPGFVLAAVLTPVCAAGCGLTVHDTALEGQDKPPNADEAALMFDASRRVVITAINELMDAVINGESYLHAYAKDAGWRRHHSDMLFPTRRPCPAHLSRATRPPACARR